MKNSDYRNAFAIGLASSVLWFFVLQHLGLHSEEELLAIVIALPFVAILSAYAAHVIFRGAFFHKFTKFLIVGMLNTGVDFFIFNTLIVATDLAKGPALTLFKTISFLGALANSYFLNRAWTFDEEAAPVGKRDEFARFAAITVAGFIVNIGITSAIANLIAPPFGISQIRWDNVAAVIATALNLVINFVGYRAFVFRTGVKDAPLAL